MSQKYIEIPLYSDDACTQFYRNLKVHLYSGKDNYIDIGGYRSGFFNNIFRSPNANDDISETGMRLSYGNSTLPAKYPPGAVAIDGPADDGFNLATFASAGTKLYVKNGGSILWDNYTYNGVPSIVVRVYSNHGTANELNVCTIKKNVLSGTNFAAMPSLGTYGECYTVASSEHIYVWGYAAYYFLGLSETNTNMSGTNNLFGKCVTMSYNNDTKQINITHTGYGMSKSQGSPNTYSTGVTWGLRTDSNQLYTLLGRGNSNIRTYDFYDPKEILPDSDNTYPGGGDDKNDYPTDGYDGGESGKGDFDNTNDTIDFPTLPTWDVQSTGFISLWKPTIVQLTNLYTFLWDSDISTTLKKLFNEPMNAIFSLGIVPVDPVTQGTRRLTIGHVDTEIDMESIQKQFVTFDFGSIDINEYYGAAWDYSPYTHASIYLPYIGVQPVDIDDIMNCTLTLRYNIDVLTGTTIALLKCVRKGRDNLNAVMYEWQGNCVTQCPITAGNWSQIMASVIQLGAMTGLALSQPVVGAIGSAVGSSAAAEYAQGKNLVNPTMATYGALNVLGSKVHVQRGGRLDMSSGAMSMQKAFVILNRPVSGIPRGWNKYAGYPSLKIKTLGSQEGFVSVGAIKLDGLRATAEEITELDTILKAGVII